MKMCRILRLDPLVRYLCKYHNALIVGTGALWLLGETDKSPGDFDIIVPPSEWATACRLFPRHCKTNSFGGIVVEGVRDTMDIWCGDIQDYFGQLPSDSLPSVAYSPDKKLILRYEVFTGELP